MKIGHSLLPLFFLIYSGYTYACRCDFTAIRNIEKDPTQAESAFIARWSKGSFQIEKHWTDIPSNKILTTSSIPGEVSKCDLHLKEGEKYLVLSGDKLKEQMPLSVCMTLVISFAEATGVIAKLDHQPSSDDKNKIDLMAKCKTWNPRWSQCKSNDECVVISNPCGWPTSSANKIFSDDAFKCNRIEGAAMDCVEWKEQPGVKRVALCSLGNCTNLESKEKKSN